MNRLCWSILVKNCTLRSMNVKVIQSFMIILFKHSVHQIGLFNFIGVQFATNSYWRFYLGNSLLKIRDCTCSGSNGTGQASNCSRLISRLICFKTMIFISRVSFLFLGTPPLNLLIIKYILSKFNYLINIKLRVCEYLCVCAYACACMCVYKEMMDSNCGSVNK